MGTCKLIDIMEVLQLEFSRNNDNASERAGIVIIISLLLNEGLQSRLQFWLDGLQCFIKAELRLPARRVSVPASIKMFAGKVVD